MKPDGHPAQDHQTLTPHRAALHHLSHREGQPRLVSLLPSECTAIEMKVPRMAKELVEILGCTLATLDITKPEPLPRPQEPQWPPWTTTWSESRQQKCSNRRPTGSLLKTSPCPQPRALHHGSSNKTLDNRAAWPILSQTPASTASKSGKRGSLPAPSWTQGAQLPWSAYPTVLSNDINPVAL